MRGRGGEVESATRVCFALSHDKSSWEEVWVNESRRGGPTAIQVRGGGCLMAGGMDSTSGDSLGTAELWDEESQTTYRPTDHDVLLVLVLLLGGALSAVPLHTHTCTHARPTTAISRDRTHWQ